MYDPDSDNSKLGRLAQKYVDAYFIEVVGATAIPVDETGGEAATLLRGPGGKRTIAMDRVYLKGGIAFFGDSKGKSQSTFTYAEYVSGRLEGSEDHGTNKKSYEAYYQQTQEAGLEGYICLVEWNREVEKDKIIPSGVLLIFRLDDIYRSSKGHGEGDMVYWRREDAIKEVPLEEIPLTSNT